MSATSFNSPRILILETDRRVAALLQSFTVKAWSGASVQSIASTIQDVVVNNVHLRSFDVILAGCDFTGDGTSQSPPLRALRALAADPAMPPIILLTESGSEFSAVQAVKAGAYDYLPKSIFSREQVTAAIERALLAGRPFWQAFAAEGAPRLFGYDMRRCLSANENSAIHTAFSAEQSKEVVIKVLNRGRGSLSRDRLFDRFMDEFKILHDIDDPAVAEIYDFRVTPEYCYMAMEYFDLGHLGGRLREPLEVREAMRIAAEIAQALSIIHMAGVVHRDLKPGNIMLRNDGTVALIDFGISTSSSLAADEAEEIAGTPYYMSPEQAAGLPTDERTDLYALGVIIYQMLTGEKPFSGAGAAEILRSHCEDDVPPLPEPLARYQPMLSRLLAKKPDDRIASARELVEMIDVSLGKNGGNGYALSASSA